MRMLSRTKFMRNGMNIYTLYLTRVDENEDEEKSKERKSVGGFALFLILLAVLVRCFEFSILQPF